MRVQDLLITESEMLLESYRDFKRAWSELLVGAHNSTTSGRKMTGVPEKLEILLKDNRVRSIMSDNAIIQNHTQTLLYIRNPLDASNWVAGLRRCAEMNGEDTALVRYYNGMSLIEREVEEAIKNRTPEYTTIKKTAEYIIFDVKNFAAAQKLRNQVKATWCIGASGDYFNQYGENKDRKTIIVFFLKKREGMVFHVDKSGSGLITSHDNDREWTASGGSVRSSRGYREFAEELRNYLDQDELVDFVKATGMRIKPEHFALSELTIVGKLEPHILKSLVNRLESGLLARVHKATAVRGNVLRIIKTDTTRAFNSGDLRAVVDDVSELFGTLYTSKTYITSDESAVDFIVCTLALVEYLDDIQKVVVGGGLDRLVFFASNPLRLALGRRGASMVDFTQAFDGSWPHIKKIILALRKVAK